ncbi:MAG: glycosyl hydrolase [Candidatus Methanomethyliaceae archaeon]
MRIWKSAFISLIIVALIVLRPSPGEGGSLPASVSAANASPPAQVLGIAHAVHLRPTLYYGQEIKKFGELVGKRPALVMYFLDWKGNPNAQGSDRYFDPYLVNTISNTLPLSDRPAIMLTWQPLHGRQATGCAQDYDAGIPLPDILNGRCDNYIRGFARALKARSERFLLRFAHEMNISDSPWWVGHIGAEPSLYVAVWRHVHRIFSEEGVPNVEWVWSPNYASNPPYPWNDLHHYYPGDAYVDWIGLSGYNWYNTRQPMVWRSFRDLYDAVLRDLACSYAKPQIIAEIGSVEGDGSTLTKAAWIQDAYQQAPAYPFLRAVQWFNDYAYADPNSADFRVTTSTAQDGDVRPLPLWTDAYRQALTSSIYTITLPSRDRATPPATYCGGSPFRLFPSFSLMAPTDSVSVQLVGVNYTSTVRISISFPNPLSAVPLPDQMDPPWGISTIQVKTWNALQGMYTLTVHIRGEGVSIDLPVQVQVVNQIYRAWLPAVLK